MSDNKYTLIRLLKEYEVRIPIIQRDYAQGRKNVKSDEVRKNIIKDILACLTSRDKIIDFNFVYGNVSCDSKHPIFFPVDGQQRLTTLYLLHWYIAVCSGDIEEFRRGLFSYMTRSAAAEFFSLLQNPPEDLLEIIKGQTEIRSKIENKSWFLIEWINDPTVDAALTVLSDLSNEKEFYINSSDFYERLQQACITFTLITEDANDIAEIKAAKSYIRMNARGKTLEPFENVKAMLDSIDDKLNPHTDIIGEYDKTYIDPFYNEYKGSLLNDRTNKINIDSLNCFKNLYNLCCQIRGRTTKNTETEYISTMYEYSQNIAEKDKEFFSEYFIIVKALLDYYCICSEHIQDAFKRYEHGFVADDCRETVAAILYIYYYKKNKAKIPTKDNIELFFYVLNNLNYSKWQHCYLSTIRAFSEVVSTYDDIFNYFQNEKSDVIYADAFANTNPILSDIGVRLKEQKIKADIIIKYNLSENYYFNDLEEQSQDRKIQYLLFISGFWDGCGIFNDLVKYIECAKKWFRKAEKNLEWCKYYAIGANIDNNDGNLKSEAEINLVCDDFHIWNDSYYFWDDGGILNDNKLKLVKNTYDHQAKISNYINDLPNDSKYDSCWLKYAIKYENIGLLDKKLYNYSGEIFVKVEGKERPYMLYVLKLVKKAVWGLKDFVKAAKAEYRFECGTVYRYDSIYSFFTTDRAYIMRLEAPVEIIGTNNHYTVDKCIYSYDYNKIYTIYQFNPQKPNQFEMYKYDMKTDMDLLEIEISKLQDKINGYQEGDYLEIKFGSISDWIQKGRQTAWAKKKIHINTSAEPIQSTKCI